MLQAKFSRKVYLQSGGKTGCDWSTNTMLRQHQILQCHTYLMSITILIFKTLPTENLYRIFYFQPSQIYLFSTSHFVQHTTFSVLRLLNQENVLLKHFYQGNKMNKLVSCRMDKHAMDVTQTGHNNKVDLFYGQWSKFQIINMYIKPHFHY